MPVGANTRRLEIHRLGGLYFLYAKWFAGSQPLSGRLGTTIVRWAQLGAERHHGKIRRELLTLDDNLGDMLAFSGRVE